MTTQSDMGNPELARIEEAKTEDVPWRKWGPYLSERQWGTVREDYSDDGDAWNYFTHDQARSRAYRWGEDGLAGISDDKQRLCFALALWNGADPILKERLFGLSNSEGNHGEDVKEYYFYLDNTPMHTYMKCLYKYPQAAFPYEDLVRTNRTRSREELEYELIDTGVFDEDRYFDVFVEYAKESVEDILIKITIWNRGPQAAPLHVLPTLWFRNTWSWSQTTGPRPHLGAMAGLPGTAVIGAQHPDLGDRFLYCETPLDQSDLALLFTENETNCERIHGTASASPYVKDAFHSYVVDGRREAVNPAQVGTKMAPHYSLVVEASGSATLRLRLTHVAPAALDQAYGAGAGAFGEHFEAVLALRCQEADLFYARITPDRIEHSDAALVMRQALAGLLWTKQYYYFDLDRWLDERGCHPLGAKLQGARRTRNSSWFHMYNDDVISMPDKWEYPWYAAWDLAFHCIGLAMVDIDFAKQQLDLMLRDVYLHPSGQIPAYEWNFSDVNPPVHAWAILWVYQAENELRGSADVEWLKRAFQMLLINFTWWVNRKDPGDRDLFSGGFLGLDNIGIFDRSSPLPTGGYLEQADGTAWMAFYCQQMLQIAVELAGKDPTYEDMVVRFGEHFLRIAGVMDRLGDQEDELWDEEDGFYYDLLRLPDGSSKRLEVRSIVGLLPLCASTAVDGALIARHPRLVERIRRFMARNAELSENIQQLKEVGVGERRLLAILDERKLRRVLARMLDESRFLSDYGIRSLSRWHLEHPYVFTVQGQEYRVQYRPAESNTGMFGGNSNWRGPVWMPVNVLIIRALLNLYAFYGDDFKVECPTGSGQFLNLYEVSAVIARRLAGIFLPDARGRRPVFGGTRKFQEDPHWRDYIPFYEYFHGDNGAGLGASHQTGWTALVAKLIQMFTSLSQEELLAEGTLATRLYQERDDEPA